ncbi:MAG: DUF58 domain-containing protein [Bifidobacteriaceae bacterium]|nr:DUF58 domain-containing protein [Bifidobacteriaceae bacterium]
MIRIRPPSQTQPQTGDPLPDQVRLVLTTGRGLTLASFGLVFLILGVAFGRADAVFTGASLAFVCLASWVALRFARQPVEFERVIPDGPVSPGKVLEISLIPRYPAGSSRFEPPSPESVTDRTPWGPAQPSISRDATALTYWVTPPQRGVYPIGPAALSYPGPLSLVKGMAVSAWPVELIVGPALLPVVVPEPDPDSDRQRLASTTTAERVTDPAAVRVYQSGDPRRLVHWRATARRDQLMVRETVTRKLADVWVLVDDAARPGYAAERALRLAASVALRLRFSRHTVRLLRLSGTTPPEVFRPDLAAARILEYFARLELGNDGTASGGGPSWVDRLAADLGTRGMTGPVYGALGHLDGTVLARLRDAAPLAEPALLWLAVPAEPNMAGWTVVESPEQADGLAAPKTGQPSTGAAQ